MSRASNHIRFVATILALATLAVVVGCAHPNERPSFWQDKTILIGDKPIAELSAIANDSGASEAERAPAVFCLFAQHLPPGCTSVEFRRGFSKTNWLRDSRLRRVDLVSGLIPVDTAFGDTVFSLVLCSSPVDEGAHWIIYFRLTGNLQEDDALAFLAGDALAGSQTRMAEFALCFPHSTSPGHLPGRIERFSPQGVHVYSEWNSPNSSHASAVTKAPR